MLLANVEALSNNEDKTSTDKRLYEKEIETFDTLYDWRYDDEQRMLVYIEVGYRHDVDCLGLGKGVIECTETHETYDSVEDMEYYSKL